MPGVVSGLSNGERGEGVAGEFLAAGAQGDGSVRGGAQERDAGGAFELADLVGGDGVPDAELAGCVAEPGLAREYHLAEDAQPGYPAVGVDGEPDVGGEPVSGGDRVDVAGSAASLLPASTA